MNNANMPLFTDSSISLVEKFNENDPLAFRSIYDEFLDGLLVYAEIRSGSAADAHDLVAEVFTQVWKKKDKNFPSKQDIGYYLFHLLINQCIMWFRKQRAHKNWLRLANHGTEIDSTFYEKEVRREMFLLIEQNINMLHPRSKTVMEMVNAGLEDAEIARRLGTSVNTVRDQRNKGTKLLKKAIQWQKLASRLVILLF